MRHFFPDPDDPEIAPFTRAFVRMMFAHAEFERRVSALVIVITRPVPGEKPKSHFTAKTRAKDVEELCSNSASKHPAGLPEGEAIVRLLDDAYWLCNDRNWLAHGHWWRLDTIAGVITVRAAKEYSDEPLHRHFTFEEIDRSASNLIDMEAKLYDLQRTIESRLPLDGAGMAREQFEAMARAALPTSDEDWGSDRQIDAENSLFDAVCAALDNARMVALEDYALKATTEERIDKARELLFGEEETSTKRCQHRDDGRGQCIDCGAFI